MLALVILGAFLTGLVTGNQTRHCPQAKPIPQLKSSDVIFDFEPEPNPEQDPIYPPSLDTAVYQWYVQGQQIGNA